MVPLTVTMGLIYGTIGWLGKDYDMPVAVLSALSLGLAVDYAIHFLSRSRTLHAQHGSWELAVRAVFAEPARAIARNVIVVGMGFLPLLATPLVPYQTVDLLIAAILLTAGAASLLILPALVTVLRPWLFPPTPQRRRLPVLPIILLLGGLAWAPQVHANRANPSVEIPVETIVQRTNCAAYYQGKDGRAQVSMTITDHQGRTRRRQFTILRRNHDRVCGAQQYYVYFHRPADVNKTALMVSKHTDRDDDRWLYLPALDLVKRIAASDKRTSFAGSHFFYEDLSGRRTTEDTHTLVQTTPHYYVLKNVPKQPQTVEFASFTMWIHRQTFIPVKVEYVDPQGRPYRLYDVLRVETQQGYPTVTQARMRDLRTQGETVMTFTRIAYNIDLPPNLITERYLRHPPTRYLR